MDDPRLPLEHPANAEILSYLRANRGPIRSSAAPSESCAPEDVEQPYMRLGTHPDVVSRLWSELDAELPDRCRWVVLGAPVLAHPHTGAIFAFAGGTVYALRLPPAEREDARRLGAKEVHHFPAYAALGIDPTVLDLRRIGPEWVFGEWRREEAAWCLAAYRVSS